MNCSHCNNVLGPGMRICSRCGTRVGSAATAQPSATAAQVPLQMASSGSQLPTYALNPAGFWRRVMAFFIDLLLVGPTAYMAQSSVLPWVGGLLVWWLYFALFESSRWQATPGKRALGLKVTDVNGVRLQFGRASFRFFGKLLSAATVGIGFLMAGLTQHKQALHDLIANALVQRVR